MEELNKYNESIIGLYNRGMTLTYISAFLYRKVNTNLKRFNKISGGTLWVSMPKYSKAECHGHVYNIIYKYKMNKLNGGN